MSQRSLSKWIKLVLVGFALCGVALWAFVIPEAGRTIVAGAPEFSGWFWPWLAFAWATAIPCYAVLLLGWKIADNIAADRSFSMDNARLLAHIARLAAADSALVFAVNLIFFFLGMNHPGVALLMLLVVFVGVAISVAAAGLSHLVRKAAELQEQSDLTV